MSSERGPLQVLVFGALAVCSGALVAVQSHLNGQLGTDLHNGVLAAAISFTSGMLALTIVVATTRFGRRGVRDLVAEMRSGRHPWWYFSGGFCGAYLVITQGIAALPLGVAMYTIGIVAGQLTGGMVIDRRGLGTLPPVSPTVTRVTGAGLAVVAVLVAVAGDVGQGSQWWLLALPLLAGIGSAFQQAVNGQVRHLTGSALMATFWNFVVGLIGLGVAAGVSILVVGPPPPLPSEWYLYIGGLVGIGFIAINAAVVSHLGVLLLTMCSVAGQVLGSIVVDVVTGHAPGATTLIGAALTLVAVVVASTKSRAISSFR